MASVEVGNKNTAGVGSTGRQFMFNYFGKKEKSKATDRDGNKGRRAANIRYVC